MAKVNKSGEQCGIVCNKCHLVSTLYWTEMCPSYLIFKIENFKMENRTLDNCLFMNEFSQEIWCYFSTHIFSKAFCFVKMSMPSGSNSVNRNTAFATCDASQYWLPEIFTKSDLNDIETAAGFSRKYRAHYFFLFIRIVTSVW